MLTKMIKQCVAKWLICHTAKVRRHAKLYAALRDSSQQQIRDPKSFDKVWHRRSPWRKCNPVQLALGLYDFGL